MSLYVSPVFPRDGIVPHISNLDSYGLAIGGNYASTRRSSPRNTCLFNADPIGSPPIPSRTNCRFAFTAGHFCRPKPPSTTVVVNHADDRCSPAVSGHSPAPFCHPSSKQISNQQRDHKCIFGFGVNITQRYQAGSVWNG